MCVHVYIVYVDAEGSWMPGIRLNNDLYVHNEAHTHTCVVDVHVNVCATCKWRVTFHQP